MRDLTDRQKQVLEAIRQSMAEYGYPPSVREIGERMGLSSSCTVQRHLEALIAKGYLRRIGSKARTIEIVDDETPLRDDKVLRIPVVGRVAAGQPVLAEQHIDGYVPVGRDLLDDGTHFALSVKGDSMIGAGLFEGDTVIVRQQDTARTGDVVVALIDGEEATVKRFILEKKRVCLKPENPTMKPFYPDDVKVLGRVVLSIRKF